MTVNVFVSPSLPGQVMADPLRLRQVFFNLLGNAIKFSGGRSQHGKVRFSIEPDPADASCIVVTVEDNGIGISEENMSQLFQVFTQAEASTTRRFGGTGLGLAICKQLVDLMGGSILAESELGKGSTFRARLPVDPCKALEEASPPRLDGMQYFVVDDPNTKGATSLPYLIHAGGRVVRVRSVQIRSLPRQLAQAGAGYGRNPCPQQWHALATLASARSIPA